MHWRCANHPRHAGKSTVLRAVAAAALAGAVGLAVPAADGAMLPHLDAIMLRTFSGDAPQEGLSSFGVEMREMRCVQRVVRACLRECMHASRAGRRQVHAPTA